MADADATEQERKELHIIQSMIDVSAQRLEGLRTQCATSAELTQQEIRTLEVAQPRTAKPPLKTPFSGQTHQTLLEPTRHQAKST